MYPLNSLNNIDIVRRASLLFVELVETDRLHPGLKQQRTTAGLSVA